LKYKIGLVDELDEEGDETMMVGVATRKKCAVLRDQSEA